MLVVPTGRCKAPRPQALFADFGIFGRKGRQRCDPERLLVSRESTGVAPFHRVASLAAALQPRTSETMAASLLGLPQAIALHGVKLLCNAWVTSRRIGRLPRSCILGRLAPDSIQHCAECEVLRLAASAAGGAALWYSGRRPGQLENRGGGGRGFSTGSHTSCQQRRSRLRCCRTRAAGCYATERSASAGLRPGCYRAARTVSKL